MPVSRNRAALQIAAALKPAETAVNEAALLIGRCFTTVQESGALAQVEPTEIIAMSRLVHAASARALECQEQLYIAHAAFIDLAKKYLSTKADDEGYFVPDCLPKGTVPAPLRIAA